MTNYATYSVVPARYIPVETIQNLRPEQGQRYTSVDAFEVTRDGNLYCRHQSLVFHLYDPNVPDQPIRIKRVNDGRLRVDLTEAGDFQFPLSENYQTTYQDLESVDLIVVDRDFVGTLADHDMPF